MIAPELLRLRGDGVEVIIAPLLGGRMLSMRLGEHEFLWHNPALLGPRFELLTDPVALPADAGFGDWQNWGGDKTWPAPQGWNGPDEWPGPPDAVLDAGSYEILEGGPGNVLLESAFDARTGLRIRRDIRVEPGPSVVVVSTLTNESARRVRWAAWAVAQLAFDVDDIDAPDAFVHVSGFGGRDPVTMFSPLGRIPWLREDDGFRVQFADVVGKIGFPDASGAVLFQRHGRPGLELRFSTDAGDRLPDQCPFQIWMQTIHDGPLAGLEGLATTARLVELEPTSALRDLGPGDQVRITCSWSLR